MHRVLFGAETPGVVFLPLANRLAIVVRAGGSHQATFGISWRLLLDIRPLPADTFPQRLGDRLLGGGHPDLIGGDRVCSRQNRPSEAVSESMPGG